MEYFYNWNDAFEYLREQLALAQPLSGRGITVENTPLGARLNLSDSPGGSSAVAEYGGTFKLFDASDESGLLLSVVDGTGYHPTNCGLVFCGSQQLDIPIFTETPSGRGYVVMTVTCANPETADYQAEITLNATIPQEYDYTLKKWSKVVVLGTFNVVEAEDGAYLELTQSWLGGNLYVTDRCV